MVKMVNKQIIATAIAEAERTTSAEIVAVVSPASDPYQNYILLYGLMLGSLVAFGLWAGKIIGDFPLLLAVQLGITALLSLLPWLHKPLLRLVPKHIRHHRAAHRAFEEYLLISRHVPAATPILLFYVSLAERYVHILPSRLVREKIPDKEWEAVVTEFTASMKSDGLEQACVSAISRMATMLAPYFPR